MNSCTLLLYLDTKVINLFFRVVGGRRDVPADVGGVASLVRPGNNVPGTLDPWRFSI